MRAGLTEIVTVFGPAPRDTSSYRYDFDADIITILDPDSGDALVTFTVDELRQLEWETNQDLGPVASTRQILYSADTVTWHRNTFESIADTQNPHASVTALHLTDTTLIALITDNYSFLPPWQQAPLPNTRIYTAELP